MRRFLENLNIFDWLNGILLKDFIIKFPELMLQFTVLKITSWLYRIIIIIILCLDHVMFILNPLKTNTLINICSSISSFYSVRRKIILWRIILFEILHLFH